MTLVSPTISSLPNQSLIYYGQTPLGHPSALDSLNRRRWAISGISPLAPLTELATRMLTGKESAIFVTVKARNG